jgi:AbrB family looped-hinge helix DNA binding protein
MKRNSVSSDGRITIPAELRKKLKLKPGTVMSWKEENGRLILISTKRLLDKIQGCLRPRPGEPSAFDMLFEERKRERIREDN